MSSQETIRHLEVLRVLRRTGGEIPPELKLELEAAQPTGCCMGPRPQDEPQTATGEEPSSEASEIAKEVLRARLG